MSSTIDKIKAGNVVEESEPDKCLPHRSNAGTIVVFGKQLSIRVNTQSPYGEDEEHIKASKGGPASKARA